MRHSSLVTRHSSGVTRQASLVTNDESRNTNHESRHTDCKEFIMREVVFSQNAVIPASPYSQGILDPNVKTTK